MTSRPATLPADPPARGGGSSFPAWGEKANYRCIRRISQATTATVWLVRRAGDGMRLHVLKELHGAEEGADWPREIALLTAQKHPFILPVVEMLRDEASGQMGMVTEYCDQGDLHSLLAELRRRGERVPESQLISWLAQLCLALSHLHRQRILHRDVKTSNCFVTADRTLKLGDFGFAKALQAQSDALLSRVGSPFYMSPEICNNQPYGTESDVWSLGCVLYEMVCLQPAFYAENMMLVLDRICSAKYDPPPEGACSDGVRELLGEMLQLKPDARPAAQQVLQHPALRPVLQQLEPPAPPAPKLREKLEAGSDEASAMREAVKAARAREEALASSAEQQQGRRSSKGGDGNNVGGLALLGLSRLAERGLSLLGFAFKQRSGHDEGEDAVAAAPTPAQQGAAARAEAEAALRGMRRQLELSLGANVLERALRLAVEAPPDEEASEEVWRAWEAAKLAQLQEVVVAKDEGGGNGETLARAVLALGLWQSVESVDVAAEEDKKENDSTKRVVNGPWLNVF